ncbi:MAG: hypothetical protein OEZ33_07385 [Gammaproteobacteria bacterium]|nr:hypothetical protein [Gammaproteobacteria bacterium]
MSINKPTILILICLFFVATRGYGDIAQANENPYLLEVQQIAQSGAPNLAIRVMDREQEQYRKEPEKWAAWERLRFNIYREHGNWQQLIDRISNLPAGLPTEFTRWIHTQQAEALLELGKGTSARNLLRGLIVTTASQTDEEKPKWFKRWRHLIVRSYLAEQKVEDAHTAILRFQQDYAANDLDVLLLRCRVLLMSQRPAEVVDLLASHTNNPEAGMLYLLAQLRAQKRSPVKVVQAGLRQMQGKWAREDLKISLWSVVAEAAQRAGDRMNTAKALEYVMIDRSTKRSNNLFNFNADSLWNAYIDYALHRGNKAQFLIGQDEKWFAAAERYFKKDPLRSRAFYALLIHRGQGEENRTKAAAAFVKSIKKRKSGGRLIKQLFTDSKHFAAIPDIPESVRHMLVDVALAQSDIPYASEVMATLSSPLQDDTSYMWYLRRARILVLGGQVEKGSKALTEFVEKELTKKSDREKIDRLLQVVFDLQTVGSHDGAFNVFNAVVKHTDDEKLKRELYYWMADSRRAQHKYEAAAHLYLKSALLPDGKGLDPWGQTARYQAAQSLGLAGLNEDAYILFKHLLRVTKEADRRAVLQHELQKLHLSNNKTNEVGEIAEQELKQ